MFPLGDAEARNAAECGRGAHRVLGFRLHAGFRV